MRVQQSYQAYIYTYVQAALDAHSLIEHNGPFSIMSLTMAFFCQVL